MCHALANPAHGPVLLNKIDLSNGCYWIDLNPSDAPKLGVVFPTGAGPEPMVKVPLVLPMAWVHSGISHQCAREYDVE